MEAEMRAMQETMVSVSGMKARRWKVDAEVTSLSIALRRGGKRVSKTKVSWEYLLGVTVGWSRGWGGMSGGS